jgi:hypothetical protein
VKLAVRTLRAYWTECPTSANSIWGRFGSLCKAQRAASATVSEVEMMDVQRTIDELKSSLEHSVAEEELLETITGKLATLRKAYLTDRQSFTGDHLAFLKSLAPVSDHLRAFVEIKEELADVRGLKHYGFLMNRLADLKGALASFAVGKRVGKEIRELNEKLPDIRQQDEADEQSRLSARIIDLEQSERRCSHNHIMVIREGRYGYFWGCSRFPNCEQTKQLTSEEKGKLFS